MKIGMRKPSINKSFKARTTGKLNRKLKKSYTPFYGKKGVGFVKNPSRSIKNKIYKKTTFSLFDLLKWFFSFLWNGMLAIALFFIFIGKKIFYFITSRKKEEPSDQEATAEGEE